ncbi:Ger(x)C family spore germination protein [Paenibacillus flagellatus]|nr:Ger(x)C family spore germination protein [Paenibacillus flagellatus]
MKRGLVRIALTLLLLLPGCADYNELDKLDLVLALGFDRTEDGDLQVTGISPVFSESAKTKQDVFRVQSRSLRESREKMNAVSNGTVVAGKVQMVLVGKRLLEHTTLFPHLDIMYRDAKTTTNAYLVAVDGTVSELMTASYPGKPAVQMYLRNMMDSAVRNGLTANVTLQKYHYMYYDRGSTAFLPEIARRGSELTVNGVALLNARDRYEMSLNRTETKQLLMLRNEAEFPMMLTADLPANGKRLPVSFSVKKARPRFRIEWQKTPHIRVSLDLHAEVTEYPSESELTKSIPELERNISRYFDRELSALLRKLQEHRVEPIGIGGRIRSLQHGRWKTIGENWPDTFAQSKVTVRTNVVIKRHGILK